MEYRMEYRVEYRVNIDLIKLNWWKATEAQTKLDNDKEKTNSEQRKRLKKEDNFEKERFQY
jgi:hypothetical protein